MRHGNLFKALIFFIASITIYLSGIFIHLFEEDYYTKFHYPYDGDITILVQQLRNNIKPDIPPINGYNYEYLKSSKSKCEAVQELRLVYLVKSAVENFERRVAIRNSWGFQKRFSDVEIRTVFLLGKSKRLDLQRSVDEESNKHADIVQGDFIDAYFNNTIKTMVGFKWAAKFCPNSQFYMFVDDDYYVSTKNVLKFVRNPTNYPKYLKDYLLGAKKLIELRKALDVFDYELPKDVRLYTGFTFHTAPHRHRTSKWYVSLDEYGFHKWPPYVTAGAYILSREALHDMYYASFYTKHFRFDDIYVGLLAKKIDIEPYHCEEFYFYKKPYKRTNYNYTIASHGYSDPKELLRVWSEQKALGNA